MLSLLQQQGVHLVSFGGVSMDPTQDDKNTLMNKLGMSFRRWCRQKHIEKPPATWNMRLIGRADSNTVYPALDTNVKAAHTKPILFFLADVAKEISDHCSCNLAPFLGAGFAKQSNDRACLCLNRGPARRQATGANCGP